MRAFGGAGSNKPSTKPTEKPAGKPAMSTRPGRERDPHAAREAARYEQPIASREMILQLLAANDGPMEADALAEKLALTAPDRFDALSKRLGAMVRDGQLLQNRRGAFAPAARMDLIPAW
jgi:ribonuclease R